METAKKGAMRKIAIVALGNGSAATARIIKAFYAQQENSHVRIYGLQNRVDNADIFYTEFGATVRDLYQSDTAIIALCAAGIVIRTLAPLLNDKGVEPPVLAIAEDGSAVVPLLGGVNGVNAMARAIAEALDVNAAITTSGELRFGTCLLNPPAGYALADIEQGKRFVADLLNGEPVSIDGDAPWLNDADLPLAAIAAHRIKITTAAQLKNSNELLIHPRSVIALIETISAEPAEDIKHALSAANIAQQSLACVVALSDAMTNMLLSDAANKLQVPLRFVSTHAALIPRSQNSLSPLFKEAKKNGVSLFIAEQPIDPNSIGIQRGNLTVIGLGPGAAEFMVPAAKQALAAAQDILGYETYVNMAGPFRADQVLHCTDNREEMLRARHAFELAAQGRNVVVVSSGDPGVFAMASAVLEALHESTDPHWHALNLQIFPGVSAALATAARAGAPLGHDFCVMSLSDNLKPWDVIENRLDHAAAADFALAFYNPISKTRPWQLGRALEIIAQHRSGDTVVVLGRDIGRPAEKLTTLTLAQLRPEHVDMRTLVIIGSSTTRTFARGDKFLADDSSASNNGDWVYTPRWYPLPPAK
ncbi:MAG: precorrin-3B C17-methyltransferase [Verrucomicrobiaceae bacterium]|nr:precorrin-3B C17-methyltransferase [Verrucomicrobiaceae bacterium]